MPLIMNWIVKDFLAIGPYPCQEDIHYLSTKGFRAIIRLTDENQSHYQIPENWLESIHVPVEDFGIPSIEQVKKALRHLAFYRMTDARTYMHCRAGYGRAGTMAAMYLVSTGLSSKNAIHTVRTLRPGTIETEQQVNWIYSAQDWIPALMDMQDLQWFMARKMIQILRKKCPWDKAQTHESLIESLMDESYEVVEAIRSHDQNQLMEELGDLMIQPLIQSQIAEEQSIFNIDDALQVMLEKLIRRHPHVFSQAIQHTPKEVIHQWAEIKQKENEHSIELPSPIREIMEISHEASKDGFEWDTAEDVLNKVSEEVLETKKALIQGDRRTVENELGDLIFAVFNAIRFLKMDLFKVMERGRRKFEIRYRTARKMMQKDEKEPKDLNSKELDQYWKRAKEFISQF